MIPFVMGGMIAYVLMISIMNKVSPHAPISLIYILLVFGVGGFVGSFFANLFKK